jgi:hypothetical protein
MIAVMSDLEQTKTGDVKIGCKILRHKTLRSSQQHSMAEAPLDFGWRQLHFHAEAARRCNSGRSERGQEKAIIHKDPGLLNQAK